MARLTGVKMPVSCPQSRHAKITLKIFILGVRAYLMTEEGFLDFSDLCNTASFL